MITLSYLLFSYCTMSFETADLKLWRPSLDSKVYVNVRRRPKTIKYVLLLKTWSSVNLVVLNCLRRLKNNVFNFVVLPDKYTWKSTWIFYFIIINHRWQNKYYRCQLLLWNAKYLHTSCLREKLKARAIKINIWMTYKAWLVIQN